MPKGSVRGIKSIHAEVLAAAQRVCNPEDWTFRPVEVVRVLPHLNERSVRTHIVSRCCENAPRHHAHRWPYFRRLARGVYEIAPAFRERFPYGGASPDASMPRGEADVAPTLRDAEAASPAIHASITESGGWYVAECVEVAAVTQGRSLDEVLGNLRSALALHLEDDERAGAIPAPPPRLIVSYETSARGSSTVAGDMRQGRASVFESDRSQAVRLPKRVAFPDGVDKVDVTVLGNARLLAPAGETWTTWFDGAGVSEDFMMTRDQPLDQERSSL